MVKNKKIILLFLGNYTYDARCINMIDSLIKDKHQVTIISETASNNLFQSYNSFTNKNIILPKNGVLRYYKFHQIIKKKLNQIKFDVLIACDIFSLAAVSKYYNQKKLYMIIVKFILNYMLIKTNLYINIFGKILKNIISNIQI